MKKPVTSIYTDKPKPPHPPHPPPEVRARPATKEEIPRPAELFEERAHEWGWDSMVFYARGATMTASGAAGKVVDSIAVRLRHPERGIRIVAVWVDGKFASGHRLDSKEYHEYGIRQLTKELEDDRAEDEPGSQSAVA